MADKTSPTSPNKQDITIASIIDSINKLGKDIANTVDEGGGSRIADEKEGSHHAIEDKNEEIGESSSKKKDPEPDGTGKKEGHGDDKSSQGSVGGGGSSRGEVMDKLNNNLDHMKVALEKLKNYEEELQEKIKRANQTSTDALKKLKAAQLSGASSSSSSFGAQENEVLQDLLKKVRQLRHQIPTLHKSSFKDSGAHDRDSGSSIDGVRTNMEIYNLPSMQMSKSLEQSSVFTEIKQIYAGLETQEKKDCLLCFAVFPENEELKKKTLTYWWEGEGLLPQPNKKGETVEKFAGAFLDDFVKKGLIEPIKKKQGRKPRSYRMNPLVHGVVAKIAEEENFFVYDDKGNPTAIFHTEKKDEKEDEKKDEKKDGKNDEKMDEKNKPICKRACLLKAEKVTITKGGRQDFTVERNVETIFNFNEPFPDLRMESFAKEKEADVAEWLSKLENLKVLYLGRWQASVKHHIEVGKTDFLEGLKYMGKLRLLSLQGVSRIDELTRSIKGLTNLKILDLKACHNLEVLPKEISYLKNLTHLDVSDCYAIDHMPKGLSNLTNLQVLEGFVAGHQNSQGTEKFCTLGELEGMKYLRKLSLNISRKTFPSTEELGALAQLGSLKKLTMSWGADLNTGKNTHEAANEEAVKGIPGKRGLQKLPDHGNLQPSLSEPQGPQLPSGLEKLNLLFFPEVRSPAWLVPGKLPNLLKLCIRGGRFGELKKNEKKWNSVKTLRLKFLSEVQMSWEELQVEFPKLECLEKVGCPRITFCPCDENGVWVNPGVEQSEEEKGKQSEQPKNKVSKRNCVCL